MSHTRATPTAKARRVRFHRASRVAHTRHHRAPPGASSTARPLLAALAPASGRVSIPQSGALTVVTLRVSAVTTDTAVCVFLSHRGPGSARTRVHSQLHHMTVRTSASTPPRRTKTVNISHAPGEGRTSLLIARSVCPIAHVKQHRAYRDRLWTVAASSVAERTQ